MVADDTAHFVKDIFHEEETTSQLPQNELGPVDTMEQDVENGEIDTSNKKVVEHSNKPVGEVRQFSFHFI